MTLKVVNLFNLFVVVVVLILLISINANGEQNVLPKSSSDSDTQIASNHPTTSKSGSATEPKGTHSALSSQDVDYNKKVGPDVAHALQDARYVADQSVGFWHAFVASISVIIVSEIGDKTFFIAAIMAMRHPRLVVFMGALSALGLMTVLSAFLGFATQIIPRKLTFYVSTALFALFGLKMLKEGYYMSADEGQEEYEEAQQDIKKREDAMVAAADSQDRVRAQSDLESASKDLGQRRFSSFRRLIGRFLSEIFLEAFVLTFLAEWGDRSQLTTIILAARENVVGVTIGGTLGHALCTGVAVLGGRAIAQRISIRTVTLIGGVVFLLFALSALVMSPDGTL